MAVPAEHHRAHPGPGEYIKIAVILAVITLVEVAVYYVPSLSGALTPILMVLSTIKFSMVVLWFMHLKFDSVLFSYLFVGGLGIAGAVLIALLFLFGASHTIVPGAA
ncbi:MAG: cytochrome C oxidase subunit IV [Dehalococcoidia bacterium]|nr:cytochrome C oxidase subunit IV [Dehalococcoidia bacterium]